MPQNIIKYILVAIGSFFLGWLYFASKNKDKNKSVIADVPTPVEKDDDKNKTIATEKDGIYSLVFNGVVVMSRVVTKEQYDTFLSQFPSGKTDGNVLNEFSDVPNKYTAEDGYYYESVWKDGKYGAKLQISKDEYDFRTKDSVVDAVNQSVKNVS